MAHSQEGTSLSHDEGGKVHGGGTGAGCVFSSLL